MVVQSFHFLTHLLVISVSTLVIDANDQNDTMSLPPVDVEVFTGFRDLSPVANSTAEAIEESRTLKVPYNETSGHYEKRNSSWTRFSSDMGVDNQELLHNKTTEDIFFMNKEYPAIFTSLDNNTNENHTGLRNFSSAVSECNIKISETERLQNSTAQDDSTVVIENPSEFLDAVNDTDGDFLDVDDVMVPYLNETDSPPDGTFHAPVVEYEDEFSLYIDQVWDFGHKTHIWDKSHQSPELYHVSLCGKVCKGGELIDQDPLPCPTIYCFDCICERPKCEIYGICCPDDPEDSVFPGIDEVGEDEMAGRIDMDRGNEGFQSDANSQREFQMTLNVGEDGTNERLDMGESNETSHRDENSEEEFESRPSKKTHESMMATPNFEPARTVRCNDDHGPKHLYVQSCPLRYGDSQTRKLCEEDSPPGEDFTLDTFTRVSDNFTGVVYRNVFCAMCNNVTERVQWEVSIECDTYMYVYSATTTDQLLNTSLRPDSQCYVEQSLGDSNPSHDIVYCSPEWISDETVGICNVTGLWPQYDEEVERACLSIEGRSFRVEHDPHWSSESPHGMYKNVFCAICNMGGYPEYERCSQYEGGDMVIEKKDPSFNLRLFSFLLGFGSRRKRLNAPMFKSSFTFETCPEGEWAAPDGSCMKVHCSKGKVLDSDSCLTALDQIRGLSYNVQVWFEPLMTTETNLAEIDPRSAFDVVMDGLYQQVAQPLDHMAFRIKFEGGFILSEEKIKHLDKARNTRLWTPIAIWISALFEAQDWFSRDSIEKNLTEHFTTASLHFNFSSYQTEYQPKAFPAGPPPAIAICFKYGIQCHSNTLQRMGYFESSFSDPDIFIKAAEVLNCPYIQFNKTMFDVYIQDCGSLLPQTTITVRIGETLLNFSDTSELHYMTVAEDDTLKVCREVLDSKLKKLEKDERRLFYSKNFASSLDESSKAQYYLTLVCVSVSMVCLLLTLFTYFTFRTLRSAAGLNNMFLCGSLLLAQASLLASAHVSGPQTLCTVLGMMTHFLWLWMFVWSFICCFHMFRVFTAKTRNSCSEKSQTSRFVWSVVLSIIAPAAVICTVVTGSHLTSGGSRSGYGHSSCYLDSRLLIGLATVLPLALVCLANIVFFAVTVMTIHKVRKLQSHDSVRKDDRRNLYIYVKLSTMTGAFWLIQILAEALDLDTLRYIAIFLNGLQGAFIFFSYMWNKRVLNLYMRSLSLKPVTSTLDSSQSQRRTAVSTLGALASLVRKADNQDTLGTISSGETGNGGVDTKKTTHVTAEVNSGHRSIRRKSHSSSSQSSGVQSGRDGCFDDDTDEAQARTGVSHANVISKQNTEKKDTVERAAPALAAPGSLSGIPTSEGHRKSSMTEENGRADDITGQQDYGCNVTDVIDSQTIDNGINSAREIVTLEAIQFR